MMGVLTFLAIISAIFVGFLQLSGWFLIPLAIAATFGVRYYHPEQSFVAQLFMSLILLVIIEWIARIASFYMTGQMFQ